MLRSPPSRRRGLKILLWTRPHIWTCRLLRGGVDWKFNQCRPDVVQDTSPPSRRRGLKKIGETISSTVVGVASFAEAWIENVMTRGAETTERSRLLRGGVDWKFFHPYTFIGIMVASFAEAWIEKILSQILNLSGIVASFAEAWIENIYGII